MVARDRRARADDAAEIAFDQRHARALHGDIGAGAHRDADLRLGQRRRVVDAVARHGDDAAFGLASRFTAAALRSGSTSATTSSIPSSPATASAVARLSPVSMTTRNAVAPQRRIASLALPLDRIGDARCSPAALPSIADQHHRLALAAPRLGLRRQVARRDAERVEQRAIADGDCCGPRPCR